MQFRWHYFFLLAPFKLSLWAIGREVKRVVDKARAGIL